MLRLSDDEAAAAWTTRTVTVACPSVLLAFLCLPAVAMSTGCAVVVVGCAGRACASRRKAEAALLAAGCRRICGGGGRSGRNGLDVRGAAARSSTPFPFRLSNSLWHLSYRGRA